MTRLTRLPYWFELGLFAQVAAGALMVGIGIGSTPFWYDEVASVSVAERNLGDIFRVLDNVDANMGLYYLLLHAWMWGGESEAWVRGFSALAAVAAIPTTAILARRLFDDAVGLVAGFLMIGNMFVVVHAQNARGYALALLLITVATLLFVEAVRGRRPVHFFAYGAVSALAVYASPLSGLVLVAHAASLPFLAQPRDLVRPFALTYGTVLLAVAPLAAVMFANGSDQVSYLGRPGLSEALDTGWEMLGVGNRPLTAEMTGAGTRPLAVAYATLIMIGLLALWRSMASGERRAGPWRWRGSLVIGWLLLPPVLLFVVSQGPQSLFLSRYLLGSAPALAITGAIGLVVLARSSRGLAGAAAAIVIGLAVLARIELESQEQRQQWAFSDRDAARMIARESRPGDGIAYAPAHVRLSIGWHLEHEASPRTGLPVDFAVAAEPEEAGDLWAREVPSDILVNRLRRYPRVWLVGVNWNWHPTPEPMLDAGVPLLRSEYRRVRSRDFSSGYRVELYERKGER